MVGGGVVGVGVVGGRVVGGGVVGGGVVGGGVVGVGGFRSAISSLTETTLTRLPSARRSLISSLRERRKSFLVGQPSCFYVACMSLLLSWWRPCLAGKKKEMEDTSENNYFIFLPLLYVTFIFF